ncbi:hypothetical protein PIB30_101039, partial [Stylosanthes scabra]|nr:hypothetical protein [Stylosanthes scabra]
MKASPRQRRQKLDAANLFTTHNNLTSASDQGCSCMLPRISVDFHAYAWVFILALK